MNGIKEGKKQQVLLGATGTSKTFTISNVIAKVNKPTLVFAHNKTLAGQLYSEFKEFFQTTGWSILFPTLIIISRGLYSKLRYLYRQKCDDQYGTGYAANGSCQFHTVTKDTIIIASVGCIYGASNPEQYREMFFPYRVGDIIDRKELMGKLVARQYTRNDMDLCVGNLPRTR